MTTRTFEAYLVRENDKSVALLQKDADRVGTGPLYLPRSKMVSITELDEMDVSFQLKNELCQRKGVPVQVVADESFMSKVW